MSFTLTSTSEKAVTIYLSPSKRKHTPQPEPTSKELYTWTFRAESVAPCYIHDALAMKESGFDSCDFFWLGRVPCRSVKIVGLVVGIQVYEKKIMYTIDDGTGVVDCNHAHRPQKSSPKRTSSGQSAVDPPQLPNPIARIGKTICVIGRVRNVYESRAIFVDHINICTSPNDELVHSRAVRQLHRTSYSLKEPFVIPAQTHEHTIFETPVKHHPADPPSSSHSSMYSSPVKSSPVKSTPIKLAPSPPKLRHPSRLHTQDLTENTFRIYVKHYMDNAPADSRYESDSAIEYQIARLPSTPTKRSRYQQADETPRQRPCRSNVGDTPKPSTANPMQAGFTLSYLRRVPELSLLGTRVVQAVHKRRQREERKRLKESGRTQVKSSSSMSADKVAPRLKRLFQWAVIQLLHEGCIILWDGPTRRCPDTVMDASRLWKSHSSGTSLLADNTLFSSTTSMSNPQDLEEDGEYLSDPQPNEESYISLTPTHLSDHVERAVKVLVDHYAEIGKPYHGATKEGILQVLHKDDLWRYVGTWSVDEALEYLKKECRVWDMGKGRWDLTM